MPKRIDLDTIIIIGAGPIIIGQACEFDYSGTQACKALREEGYKVTLVNSNPATIMTDPDVANQTYIEPITPESVEAILIAERTKNPDDRMALLPTMGGQTGLNTALALDASGALERLEIELIGARADVIDKAEDRQRFKEAMEKIGLECPRAHLAHSVDEALTALEDIGLPAILRPSFTMGGTGGGIAYNRDQFLKLIDMGLRASPTNSVLVEESVIGWKEYEMEVVRDFADNCIIVCSIENIDPMGVHTGDSITVAPALTLTDKEYQVMRNASIAVLREIGVETGGSNVQFAVNPKDGRLVVIEMNPRVSRSSALASKATGFPIAKVAAKLAVGFTLDEIQNDITKSTPASFEPSIDYVVVKIPRFTFEKFPGTTTHLTTSMKSVGEAMAIGRNFAEAMQKALRSLETGLDGFNNIDIPNAPDKDALRGACAIAQPDRILAVAQAMRHGLSVEEIHRASNIDPWFLHQIKTIIKAESKLISHGLPKQPDELIIYKKLGFADSRIAYLTETTLEQVKEHRQSLNLHPTYRTIDTCAGEFSSKTSYMYGAYEGDGINPVVCESNPTDRKKVIILGGGPNRIGQGIEFDYCCVHACYALREANIETIMINCNPETVSTDYDTSDRLYFEPLCAEDVIAVIENERKNGELLGAIVQFGGQTPLKLAPYLENNNIPILGTSPDMIDLAEDRERFQLLLKKLDLNQPENGIAHTREEAIAIAQQIGFPVVIRPSHVLGGRAMEIVHDHAQLEHYIDYAVKVSGDAPVLIDHYLDGAIEVDVDALSDGEDVYIAGVMEHIEQAGIHSGDSACCLPPHTLSAAVIEKIKENSHALAKALNVVGLMNVQYAVKDEIIYIIEVNPRASRTTPFVAKATGIPIAKIAARLMVGEKLKSFKLDEYKLPNIIAVKEAVFPFDRFPNVDVVLGPEMRSTGEVMGMDDNFDMAFAKAQLGAGNNLPKEGVVFVSVRAQDKAPISASVQKLADAGFRIIATHGTARYLREQNIAVEEISKVIEGSPHIVDSIINGEVALVFNTTEGQTSIKDSFSIRRSALQRKVPYYTTLAGADAATKAIMALINQKNTPRALQSILKTG